MIHKILDFLCDNPWDHPRFYYTSWALTALLGAYSYWLGT